MTDPAVSGVAGRPLRVLLVGAGRRIQGNFLPALRSMPDRFAVAGIYSRTWERLAPVAERWGVPGFASLDAVDVSGVDVVAASVPTSANAAVLQALHARLGSDAARVRLVIDTPIAWTKDEFNAVLPQLKGFGGVVAAEDYMNYPPFDLVRRAVAEGLVGTPRSLTLTNTGFLYHGLALIRSFVDFAPVIATSRTPLGSHGASVHYRFRGGFEAHVIGPYRGHSTGGLVLEGDKGVITEFPADLGKQDGRAWHLLSYRREEGHIGACVIEGPAGTLVEPTPAIGGMMGMPFENKADINMLRSCGLMRVFEALIDPANLNNRYGGAEAALYDSFVSQRATRGQMRYDPFTLVGSNLVSAYAWASTLRRRAA